jgi:hypothetical protein
LITFSPFLREADIPNFAAARVTVIRSFSPEQCDHSHAIGDLDEVLAESAKHGFNEEQNQL